MQLGVGGFLEKCNSHQFLHSDLWLHDYKGLPYTDQEKLFFFFFWFRAAPWHMEVPRLEV